MHILPSLIVSPTRVVTHPTDTFAVAPFSAQFTCSVQAYGYINITWYRNNHDRVPSKAYSTLMTSLNETTSILTIPKVTSKDVGTYYCVGWANRQGVQSLKAKLSFVGKIYLNIYGFLYSVMCIIR